VISKYGKVRWVLTSACGRHSSVLRASACRPSCCDLSRASFMYKQAASLQSQVLAASEGNHSKAYGSVWLVASMHLVKSPRPIAHFQWQLISDV